MTDLQFLCSRTVAHMQREFNAHKDMTIVYKVLAEDVPYIAAELASRSHLPYNTCVDVAVRECAAMFTNYRQV